MTQVSIDGLDAHRRMDDMHASVEVVKAKVVSREGNPTPKYREDAV